jgi:hypothetical protein
LADPSFHEGNVPLEVVQADAATDKGGPDKAGSNASVESKVRRSMPERRIVSFMRSIPVLDLGLPKGAGTAPDLSFFLLNSAREPVAKLFGLRRVTDDDVSLWIILGRSDDHVFGGEADSKRSTSLALMT